MGGVSVVQGSLRKALNGNAAPVASRAAPDFRVLFETAPGLFIVLDPGLVVVAASDAYCRAAGVTREDIVGSRAHEDMLAGGELRASLIEVLQKRTPNTTMAGAFEASPAAGANGETRREHWRRVNTPVLGDDGEVMWIIHALEDMSEAVRACHDEITRRTFAHEERRKVDKNGRPIEAPSGGWGSFP
jgi:PAS domain S-box-containing protein